MNNRSTRCVPLEGVDRCHCGSKYWIDDFGRDYACASCHEPFQPTLFDDDEVEVDPQTCPHPETTDYGYGWECERCGEPGQPMFGSAERDPKSLHRVPFDADITPAVTKSGRVLTNADFEALADEAERGYDVSHLHQQVVSDARMQEIEIAAAERRLAEAEEAAEDAHFKAEQAAGDVIDAYNALNTLRRSAR